jgi:hypothetical protein
MVSHNYVFIDKFIVPCSQAIAYQFIRKIEEYPRWWGMVYKRIRVLKEAPPDGAGGLYEVAIQGFLPYTLTLQNQTTLVQKPDRIEFIAVGDLEGRGTWLFEEVEGGTQITFDWRVAANKPIIRLFSFLLKPLFRANHVYCMKKAEEGLLKELARRRNVQTAFTTAKISRQASE